MSNRLAKLTQNVDQDNVWPNDKYLSPFINKVWIEYIYISKLKLHNHKNFKTLGEHV